MSKLSDFLTNIANAIRNLKGTTEPINAQNFATEINSMKEALNDTTATPEDIVLGKTAFVNGQKVEGTYKTPTSLKKYLSLTRNCNSMFKGLSIRDLTGYIAYEDTAEVTDMTYMFADMPYITTIPQIDTSNATNMSVMFIRDKKLINVPALDTSNANNMASMFENCPALETIPLLDLRKITNDNYVSSIFYMNRSLKNLKTLNIKVNLQVGSGSSWGHLLTLESLLGLCQECVNVNSSRTLTVGSANLTKLSNLYVKLTNQPEEDETLPKIPMVQCESTDEGAMLISEYMKLKNWTLQ